MKEEMNLALEFCDTYWKKELKKAEVLQNELRSLSLLKEDYILDIKVKSLTPFTLFLLDECQNPFVCSNKLNIDIVDVVQFLWIVRHDFDQNIKFINENKKLTKVGREFMKKIYKSKFSFEQWKKAIFDFYFKNTFDINKNSGKDNGVDLQSVHWIFQFQEDKELFNTPINLIIQRRRLEMLKNGYPIDNPLCDSVITKWMHERDKIMNFYK
jgi:hypothetical protein